MQYRRMRTGMSELRRYGDVLRPKRRKCLRALVYAWGEFPRSRQRYYRKPKKHVWTHRKVGLEGLGNDTSSS